MQRLTERYIDGTPMAKGNLLKNGLFEIIEKLAKYEDLEEQGLLHIAPLKDGTPIFIIYEDYVGFGDIERSVEKTSYLHGVTEYEIGELNKDYWLTYEEAEKVLRSGNKENVDG